MSKQNEIRVCIECFTPFHAEPHPKFDNLPLRCPKCRPQSDPLRRFIRREKVNEWTVINQVDWPRLMLRIDKPRRRNGDLPYLYDKKGREHGASWSGRIVVWAKEPPRAGQLITIREMKSTWQMKAKYEKRFSIGASMRSGYPVEYMDRSLVPLDSDEGQFEEEEHRYFVLEPAAADAKPAGQLVLVTRHSKTTLKGYGRQYHEKIVWPKGVQRLASAGGAYRSGRADGSTVLAIIPINTTARVETSGVTGSGMPIDEVREYPPPR